jgi:hypothetical protein
MAEQTDPRMQHAVDVIVRIQRLDQLPAATVEAFMPYIRKDAALLLEAIDGPDPTWRDVFRAMRAENVRLRRFVHASGSADRNAWKLWDSHDNELGCIVRETGYGREEWTVSFTYERGPAASISAAQLRPVDVLTLARISGLIGGAS